MSPLVGRPSLEGGALMGRAALLLICLVLASVPLSQLLLHSSWLTLTLVAAAPVIGGGVALRSVVRHQMLAPVLQAGLLVVLVVVVELVLGLTRWQEGPLAMARDQAEIFTRGVDELASGIPPLTLGAPGTVVIVALIGLTALLLDLMYLDLGWHTPTGLLLICSLLIPALQQPAGGQWWQVAAPVLAGAMIFATRTVHGDPRYLRGDRRPQAGPLAHHGRTVGAVALCVALVAALTPLTASLLPQVAPTRLALNVEMLQRWQHSSAAQLGPVMIDDDVSVRRSLLQREETEVLRFTTTAEDPSYLRLRTLNRFDGETFRSAEEEGDGGMGWTAFSDARDDGRPASGGNGDFIATDVEIVNFAGDRLPVPENVRSLEGGPALEEAMEVRRADGEVALGPVSTGLPGQQYTVRSEPRRSTPEQLRAVDPAVFEQPFDVGYTSRTEVPEVASELADQLVADAGAETAYDTALAVQDYFRQSFAYSLTVNSAPGEEPLTAFLEERVGYCEQFAAAFALMMTSQGYPSRVVIGFTAGQQDGEEWSVTSSNAHAWPEVWFGPEHGWVRFEPTPAAAANGVREPDRSAPAAQDDVLAPTPEATAEEEPTEEAADPQSPAEEAVAEDAAGAQASDAGGAGPSAATVRTVKWGVVIVMGLGGLLAAGAAVTVIGLRRRRVRGREERWAALPGAAHGAADGDGPVAALAAERWRREAGDLAWSEISRELAVRRTAIRWLRITGAWGGAPAHLVLDPALPPHRALAQLLDEAEAAELEVTPAHRAAAGRIADAYVAARYAAPLPDAGSLPGTGSLPDAEPLPDAVGPDAPGRAPRAASEERAAASPPLRADADALIALIRAVR